MAAVAAEYEGRVNIVGVGSNGPVDDMESFLADHGVADIVHVADPDGAVRESFGLDYQPAYAFIDDTGAMQAQVVSLDADGLRAAAEQLLAS